MMINLPIRGPHLVWVLQHLWVCLPVLPSTAGICVFAATLFGFQWKFQVPRWFFGSPYSVMFSLTQLSLFLGHSTLRYRCIWEQKLSPKNRNWISINKIHCSVSAIKQAEKLNNIQNRKRIFLPLTHCGRPELWYCSYISLVFNYFHSGSADSLVNTRCEGRWAQGISKSTILTDLQQVKQTKNLYNGTALKCKWFWNGWSQKAWKPGVGGNFHQKVCRWGLE